VYGGQCWDHSCTATTGRLSANLAGSHLKADYHRMAERRPRNVARVAVARRLVVLVFYGLRDG
jgi:hypothetical protein